jgi:hypothetical protein
MTQNPRILAVSAWRSFLPVSGSIQAFLLACAQTILPFVRRLDKLGWKDGANARIEVRWWMGGPEQMRPLMAELLAFSRSRCSSR